MKKIIFALAVAVVAATVQASTFLWTASGTSASKTFYGADGTSTIAGMTVYLFDVATIDQGGLVTALRGDGSISDYTPVATSTLDSNSRIVPSTITYGEVGGTYDFFMAIVDGDNLFVSASVKGTGQASATPSLSFSALKTATQRNLGDAAYSAAGWYTTVPEPTSGLLMLVGLAGLALRRRRA